MSSLVPSGNARPSILLALALAERDARLQAGLFLYSRLDVTVLSEVMTSADYLAAAVDQIGPRPDAVDLEALHRFQTSERERNRRVSLAVQREHGLVTRWMAD